MVELYSRKIEIESVMNFRDLGGYRNRHGATMVWRRIFRSGDFRNITAADFAAIEKEIGLTSIIDLRTSKEAEQYGKRGFSEAGIRYTNIPLMGGGNKKEEARWLKECTNLGEFYLHIISEKKFPKQMTAVLKMIADPKNYPLVFHCAIGKDRTGILSAILLSILEIDDEMIIEDYTLSGPAVQKLRENMKKNHVDEEMVKRLPDYFWEAAPESMELFLSTLKKKYGSVAGYLINLGVRANLIEKVRKALLT
jgi:protein-tyrosine phosphatase